MVSVFLLKMHHYDCVSPFQDDVTAQVKILVDLKAQYQTAAGKPWQPGAKSETTAAPAMTASAPSVCSGNQTEELRVKIDAQGNTVRQLKSSSASKVSVCLLLL